MVRDPDAARAVAAKAILGGRARAEPSPDLIHVALKRLVEGCFELPAFSTLDEMASRIRGEVNDAMFAGITGRAGARGVAVLDGLLDPAGPGRKTGVDRVKRSAPRASWSKYRTQIDHLHWVDSLGDAAAWVEGSPRRN